ncbi:MAG: hypothetical protein J6A05_10480, partial [Oscillospiraceae bacterium]|nr:hypothetical protein [Oscillospiraceae bacterium]
MTKLIAIIMCALLLTACAQENDTIVTETTADTVSFEADSDESIKLYIEYVKENHSADMDYELIFLNVDNDNETEMIMTTSYSNTHCVSNLYDIDNSGVYKIRVFNNAATDYLVLAKCRGINEQEFFVNFDRDRISYVSVDNTYEMQTLFFNGYYDEGSPETAVKIYKVSDYVAECTGKSFEHITIEGVTAENLVTEDVYNEMLEAFKQSVEFIPTDVKRVKLTPEQLDTLSADEIYNMIADSILAMSFTDFEEPFVWLKGVLEKAISETNTDLNGNPTSTILAYGDINRDGENEFFIGNWNVSVTSSLCKFRLFSEDGVQLVDSEFYSMDNTPFSAVYYDAENEIYIAENSYFLKDTDGAEIQRVQRLVYNEAKWNIETEDIDSTTVQAYMGEQIDVDFSVIKISDINDIDKVLEGINDKIIPQALASDDTARPLIFIETQTPCDPDTDLQMDFEYASTLLHDELEADGKFPEGAIILDDGAYKINGTIYHCLAVCSDNGENISRMGNFCVSDIDRTAVYICFDPTIDTLGMFGDYAGEIDEDDGRTRLIMLTGARQASETEPSVSEDTSAISEEPVDKSYFVTESAENLTIEKLYPLIDKAEKYMLGGKEFYSFEYASADELRTAVEDYSNTEKEKYKEVFTDAFISSIPTCDNDEYFLFSAGNISTSEYGTGLNRG